MKFKLLILLILLSISGSRALAAPITISGLVTNAGVPVRNQLMYIKAPGADTNMFTGPAGNYSVTISPSVSSGKIRVFYLSCRNDTTDTIVNFGIRTTTITANLNGCLPTPGFVRVNGFVSNYKLSSQSIKVLFSKDDFQTLFDSTQTDTNGNFSISFKPTSNGTLHTRIRDCNSMWSVDSVGYNVYDSLFQNLEYCRARLHSGIIYNASTAISPSSAILLCYKYIPSKEEFQFHDTITILSNGTFQFLNDTVSNYLLKVVPKDTARFIAPTYFPNGTQWDNSKSKAVGPHTRGIIRIDIARFSRNLGTNSISGSVRIDPDFRKPGFSAKGVLLIDSNNSVVDFTYADSFDNFSFQNINEGDFKVWLDECGIPTNPKEVTLTRNNPAVTDIVLTANSKGISYDEFVGLNDQLEKPVFEIYPNPFNEILNLNLEPLSDVVIYDVTGKIIDNQSFVDKGNYEIDTKNWHSGVYVITIQNKKELYRRKLIKR